MRQRRGDGHSPSSYNINIIRQEEVGLACRCGHVTHDIL